MRLKQLLGTALLAIATTAIAGASVAQLSGVLVKNRDNAGVVTILANGTFTHTEYRPADNLMLVDLAGVSVAHPDAGSHPVFAPGVRSYRILSYRSADGAQTARIELSLLPGAKAEVADIAGGLEVRLTGAPAVTPSKEAIAAAAEAISHEAPPSHIRNVSVSQGGQGVNVEINGSGPLTAKTMRLTSPERVVLDIPNSLLDGRPREIAVNSNGVKDVRVARYQADPPVTRVVLDLEASRDFDVVPSGNRLTLRLNDVARNTQPAPSAVPAVVPSPSAISETNPGSIPAAAQTPPVPAAPAPVAVRTEPAKVESARARADRAASHITHDGDEVSAASQPPYAASQPPYAASASLAAPPAAINAALQAQASAPAPPPVQGVTNCTGGRFTGEPISIIFQDMDLKAVFRIIQEISGLNVVLDPAVKGTVSIYLNDVPWDQALSIVLQNNGLDCQLQGNVLRIATLETLKNEAEARRAQQEAQALAVPKLQRTYYLSYGQARDASVIVKKFLSPRGDVMADIRSNALIVEDIPSILPKIESIIARLDRKTPEVEIEARVVASTRTFARDIGTQLGFGFGSGNNAVGGSTVDSPIKVTGLTPKFITGTAAGTIPLFSNLPAISPTSGISFVNATNGFRLDFILTMAESRGLLKVLSRPHVVTQNNIQALIRQGQRVPIVTQAQLGGPPTVQYIDAFLRLTVTPQITNENTIFLSVDVENTVPDFSHVTGAQVNPALNTQQATTSVLVTDGGTVVIGGVIQTQNNLAVNQVPVLGSLPLLGHLFKHTAVNTSTQELIFFITPKIIQT
jgi:type IV pilus assembly protein PilQ